MIEDPPPQCFFNEYQDQNVEDSEEAKYSIEMETTPVIFEEFIRCNSEYVISEKDSYSAISSDGEFNDACRIDVYDEDDSHIDRIEAAK